MSLDEIKEIIQNPNFDRINALKEHKIKLLEKRKQIDMLLDKEAHAGVAQMYVCDERFKEYYDKHWDGLAEFLRDAIVEYTRDR